jgi:hypothetical protein
MYSISTPELTRLIQLIAVSRRPLGSAHCLSYVIMAQATAAWPSKNGQVMLLGTREKVGAVLNVVEQN